MTTQINKNEINKNTNKNDYYSKMHVTSSNK